MKNSADRRGQRTGMRTPLRAKAAIIIRLLWEVESELARWATTLRLACARASRDLLAAVRAAGRAVALWWGKPNHRQFVRNVMIGIGILVVLELAKHTAGLASVRQATLDWQIAMLAGTESGADLALVDIDESTESSYQDQAGHAFYFTPRDKVQKLIEAVVAARPRVVVVDIDLSQPAILTVPQNGQLDPVQRFFRGNWVLSEYLREYPRTCAPKPATAAAGSCVPIILTRAIRESIAPGGQSRLPTPRPSFVDSAVNHSPTVFWGSATFDHEDDFIVRRWRLWEPVCEVAGRGDVIPSAALLAVALSKGWTIADTPSMSLSANESTLAWGARVSELHDGFVQRFAPTDCAGEQKRRTRSQPQEKPKFVGPIPLTEDNLSRTLRYSIRWSPKGSSKGLSLANQFWALPLSDFSDKHPDIACHGDKRPCATDKIVVIGSTYRDNGDYHRTPTGEMPGTFVLVNAINSLLQPRPVLKEVDPGMRVALELSLIFSLSGLLVFLDPIVVLLVATVGTLLICLPLSFYFLEAGVWLDLSLPLVGILVHEWVARAERVWEHRKVKAT